ALPIALHGQRGVARFSLWSSGAEFSLLSTPLRESLRPLLFVPEPYLELLATRFDLIGYSWYDSYVKFGEKEMYRSPVTHSVMMTCSAMATSHGYLPLGRNRVF
ncbi:MAG: hypothetical protein ACK2UI_04515, partial [Anaerolineae bacterium]